MFSGKGRNGDTATTPINGIVTGVRADLIYPKTPQATSRTKSGTIAFITNRKTEDLANRAKASGGNGESVKSATNANTQFVIAGSTGASPLTNVRLQGKDEGTQHKPAPMRSFDKTRTLLQAKRAAHKNVNGNEIGFNPNIYKTFEAQEAEMAKTQRKPGLDEFPQDVNASMEENAARWDFQRQQTDMLANSRRAAKTAELADARQKGIQLTAQDANDEIVRAGLDPRYMYNGRSNKNEYVVAQEKDIKDLHRRIGLEAAEDLQRIELPYLWNSSVYIPNNVGIPHLPRQKSVADRVAELRGTKPPLTLKSRQVHLEGRRYGKEVFKRLTANEREQMMMLYYMDQRQRLLHR